MHVANGGFSQLINSLKRPLWICSRNGHATRRSPQTMLRNWLSVPIGNELLNQPAPRLVDFASMDVLSSPKTGDGLIRQLQRAHFGLV